MSSRLRIEYLTSDERNKTKIKTFHSVKSGKGLEKYLKENAWIEDQQGITKVYLVKDVETDDIVFFFALSAGLLYKEVGADDSKLTETEKDIIDYCCEAYEAGNETMPDEVFSWYEDESIDKEKVIRIFDERLKYILAARDDPETGKSVNIRQVLKTFPGIVLTHFCKNADYSISEKLAFPIGFYVFWEIVAKEVLHVASHLGCQYLYLFAADDTKESIKQSSSGITVMYSEDWDEEEDVVPVCKLVEYYKNELKFEDVQDVTILKPFYDFSCVSLIQSIYKLSENRNAAWIQHSDVDE